jgi:putative FmdB family regulatory protein
MPIYEYECTECGNTFSRLQNIGASADGIRCPKCKSENLERLLSSFTSTSTGSSAGGPAPSCSSGFT